MNECQNHKYQVEGEITSFGCPYCRIEQLEQELRQANDLVIAHANTISRIETANVHLQAENERLRKITDVPAAWTDGYTKARQDTAREIAELCKKIMKKVITSNVGCGDYKHNCAHFNALRFDEAIKSKLGLEG